MKRNMGTVDRVLRAFVAAPLLVIVGLVFGWSVLGAVAFVLAGVMLVTAATGFCPTYVLLGISTQGGLSTHGQVGLDRPSRTVTHR